MSVRRRLSLAMSCVAFATILAGGTVSAGGSFSSSVSNKVCQYNGGAFGHGSTSAKGYLEEIGRNGTNYLRIIAALQSRQGGWHTVTQRVFSTDTFANNNMGHYAQRQVRFNLTETESHYESRLKFTFQWWDERPGNDHKVHQEIGYGKTCSAVQ